MVNGFVERMGEAAQNLPVARDLPRLRQALARRRSLVLVALPGTGKTTLVPPLMADVLAGISAAGTPQEAGDQNASHAGVNTAAAEAQSGRVIVTQPRRIAARAAARRIATLLGESVGESIGYAVRGERRSSASTRVEIVTTGVLLRRLQRDPDLPGVGAIILDEVHERSLESDLLLALLSEARLLREDLRVVAMSATADLTRLPQVIADDDGPAAVMEIPSALHPVEERFAPAPRGVARLDARGVPREFLAHVASTALAVLKESNASSAEPWSGGSMLVFVPGAREVDELVVRLREGAGALGEPCEVYPLHGRLPSAAQDDALAPSAPGTRRIIVSTDVAESSLTVPGVRIVIDACLAREPRVDVATGMAGLVTVGASRAASIQRAGRAGREGPGLAVRCCTEVDWARAPQAATPEILSTDLADLALNLAVWGNPTGGGLAWIDEPPAAAMAAATTTLTALGLTDASGHATAHGQAVARIPAALRPAHALLASRALLGDERASQAVALLTADLRAGEDLSHLATQLASGRAPRHLESTWRDEARRLARALAGIPALPASEEASLSPSLGEGGKHEVRAGVGHPHPTRPSPGEARRKASSGVGNDTATPDAGTPLRLADTAGWVAALAWPEWVARRRGDGAPSAGQDANYLCVGGRGMSLPAASPLADSTWLAVADASRIPGRADARIRAAAPISEALALQAAAGYEHTHGEATWEGDELRATRHRSLGAITLASTPEPLTAEVAGAALLERCQREGLGILPWQAQDSGGSSAATLRARLGLLGRAIGEPWPAMEDAALLDVADVWLLPAASTALRRGRLRLADLDLSAALRSLLPWPAAAQFDELAPERLAVPSGSHPRLRYLDDQGRPLEQPILAAKLQECFGLDATPTIAGGRVSVLMHLLSPAGRPLAITEDLRSFWSGPYQQVRADMRGRYPKHPWPEDPWSAQATARTTRRK